MLFRFLTAWLPARSEWIDVWDILMSGLAFPFAAIALWAVGIEGDFATAAIWAKLPFGAIVIALILKLFQEMAPEMPAGPANFHQTFWASCILPLLIFWVLYFTGQAASLSPVLLFAGWLVLAAATLLPRLLSPVVNMSRYGV